MSGVIDAGAGPPAGEVSDDTEPVPVIVEPAPATDGTPLDAVLIAAGTGLADAADTPQEDRGTEPGPGDESDAPGDLNGASHAAEPDQAAAGGQGLPEGMTPGQGLPRRTPGQGLPGGTLPGQGLPRRTPGQSSAARRPETLPARLAPERTALSPAQDAAAYEGETRGKRRISRRALIQASLIGGAGVAALPLLALIGSMTPSNEPLPTNLNFSLNSNWLFGGQYMAGSESSFYDDSGFAPVTVPHAVTPLSWRYWNAGAWEQLWIYRRHFNGGPLVSSRRPGNRIMVEFDGVMVNATVVINDQTVVTHQGGYLPFSAELTGHVTSGDNLLAVLVDANCLPVPPMSYGRGPNTVDFFQPGGIYRDVRLRVLPQAFLSDMFALPVDVLSPQRRVDVECTIDSALPTHADGSLLVELFDGAKLVAQQASPVSLDTPGVTSTTLSLTGLDDITLWSTDSPKLYTVQATLSFPGVGRHVLSRRIGFRDASFQSDGFYLNGERLQLFGLNRHQLYPYAGMAMPARVQRMDAKILKQELNCNMVRCSHYPQSPHFLDACDELGLLVWEEAPGWHNVSAAPGWQDLVVQNVRDMVRRDRSRPSVIIWGTRLNETPDIPGLWAATKQAAAQLDGSRPSSGAMAYHRVSGWNEDVFAYNDYFHDKATGEALLRPPLTGLPYLITEAVGVDEAKPQHFSWTDSPGQLAKQAALHGEAQSLARSEISYAGMLAWAAFDYASPEGLDPESLKYAGVADTFRVPKPGAAIYQTQVDPAVRPVIVPVFFWQPTGVFPFQEPTSMIASNCERLEIYINGAHVTTGLPATGSALYGHLAYPPFLVQLPARVPHTMPNLVIEGYVGNQQVTELRMSSNPADDTLALAVDDATIVADGSDATRAVFRAVDEYGNQRRYLAGEVTLTLSGPATLIGDNPFAFGAYGGLGAVWIRSLPGQTGTITLAASQPELGQAQVQVRSVPATGGSQLA
jgi:beta-galactosidase